jgi:hypothetical protein
VCVLLFGVLEVIMGPIVKTGSGLPSRGIIHGVEGVGKSSLGAFLPKPVFGMTRGETGLLTLIDSALIPETDHFSVFEDWKELTSAVEHLIVHDTGHKTFVLDTLNGSERLCFEHVCKTKFNGSWSYFQAYAKGPDVAQESWIEFLSRLDRLREARHMAILLLCHSRIKTFKNPEGDDYDRYTPDLHEKFWGLSHKWADYVLFANFETFAKKEKGELKAKGISAGGRVLYATRTAAWDAKNRLGLPAEIPMGNSPGETWSNFRKCLPQKPNERIAS